MYLVSSVFISVSIFLLACKSSFVFYGIYVLLHYINIFSINQELIFHSDSVFIFLALHDDIYSSKVQKQ